MIRHFTEFTEPWLHNKAKEQLLNPSLDWNFPTFGGSNDDLAYACFGRCALNMGSNYVNWNRVESLTYVFDSWVEKNRDWFVLDSVGRCMMNFYTPGQQTEWHNDNYFDMPGLYSLLYYVNDSDGGTEFKDQKFQHRENTGIFFNSYTLHRPTVSTVPRRISVSWVLKGIVK
jgi:hypothetical protein